MQAQQVPGWNDLDSEAKTDWKTYALDMEERPEFHVGRSDQLAQNVNCNPHPIGSDSWFDYEVGYRVTDSQYIHG